VICSQNKVKSRRLLDRYARRYMTILRLSALSGVDQIRRVITCFCLRRLGIGYGLCAVVGCWAPHRVANPSSFRSRACTEGQVPVLHNPTERSTPIFVTDTVRQLTSRALAHQTVPIYGTRESGVLRAGATDTMFDVSAQEIASSPGADFACVLRPKTAE
jgi:hypothetical protein